MLKNLNHPKQDSDDLIVLFEATRYCSGELKRHNPNHISSQNKLKEDYKSPNNHHEYSHERNQEINSKQKKQKQPGSPGGRLANLLNSIFVSQKIQTAPKNPSSTTTKSSAGNATREDAERKRTRKTKTNTGQIWNTKSAASKSPLPPTPTPREKMPSSFFKYKSKSSNIVESVKENGERRTETERLIFDWLDEKSKCSSSSSTNGLSSETTTSKDISDVGKGYDDIFGMVDDGWDSDSSSDLFELEIGHE